jgi:uncharacterized protein
MEQFRKIFGNKKPIIGMIHVKALPGTPKSKNDVTEIVNSVKNEAEIYKKSGIDAVMVENMHDVPYLKNNVGPEIISSMTAVAIEVKKILGDIPVGIQILSGANKEALAVAKTANLQFIRVEGFVFGHVADEGYIDSCAAELLRYRKQICAENIMIFTDIKKKHSSHAITSDVNISETAHAAEFFMSNGVIVTGTATGKEASEKEIKDVKKNVKIPVLVGSGVTINNLKKYLKISDGIIVGSYFKKDGFWENELDFEKIKKFLDESNKLRRTK